MALSRIWTAFIVIALLVAGGRFLMEPGQEQLFSHLATGKNTDTVSTRLLDSANVPAFVHNQLLVQKTAVWGKEKVVKSGDGSYRVFRLLPANGVFETTKDAVQLCISLIGIMDICYYRNRKVSLYFYKNLKGFKVADTGKGISSRPVGLPV